MALLKYKTDKGWKILYGGLLSRMLRKDKNLADVEDIIEARQNLGLLGDVHLDAAGNPISDDVTHNHDSRYVLKIDYKPEKFVSKAGDTMAGALNFKNNTWNKMGDDANIGDHNIAGHFAVQGINAETGIAFFKKSDDSNYGTLNYTGTQFAFNKPVNIAGNTNVTGNITATGNSTVNGNSVVKGAATVNGNTTVGGNATINGKLKVVGGFIPDIIDTPQLNNYSQKVNFIYGSHPANTNNHLTPFLGTSGCDYGGIVFGYPLTTTKGSWGGCITQLITNGGNGSRLLYRSKDSYTDDPWGAWKQIATMDDLSNIKTVDSQTLSTNNGSGSYIRFPDGLQICYGRSPKMGDQFISFLKAFKIAPVVVTTEVSDHNREWAVNQVTTTSFKGWVECDNSDGDFFYWIAIGRWK